MTDVIVHASSHGVATVAGTAHFTRARKEVTTTFTYDAAYLGGRGNLGDNGWQLFHERLPPAVLVAAPPDSLPPHEPHQCHAEHVMQYLPPTSTPGRDGTARRAAGRRHRARDRHDQQPVEAVHVLDMDAVEAEQEVTAGTRAEGRALVSAPRSRVKHVEVLGRNQVVRASGPRRPRPLPADHHAASLTPTKCPKSH